MWRRSDGVKGTVLLTTFRPESGRCQWDGSSDTIKRGMLHQASGTNLRECGIPLWVTLNSRGFTQILPSLRREPHFQNSPSAPMTGRLRQVGFRAAGAAALLPSFAREGSGSSGRSFKVPQRGMPHSHRLVPDAGCSIPLFVVKRSVPLTPPWLRPKSCQKNRPLDTSAILKDFFQYDCCPGVQPCVTKATPC